MTSNEIDTIGFAAEMIQPKLEARKAAWEAWRTTPYNDAAGLAEARKAHSQATQDLVVAVELYLPTILSAVERAKEAA